MKHKLLFLAIFAAAEGLISALIGIEMNEANFLIGGAVGLILGPVFLIFEWAYGAGKMQKKCFLSGFFFLAEGILAALLCATTFASITYYVALGCMILAPVTLVLGLLPRKKKRIPKAEPTEEGKSE